MKEAITITGKDFNDCKKKAFDLYGDDVILLSNGTAESGYKMTIISSSAVNESVRNSAEETISPKRNSVNKNSYETGLYAQNQAESDLVIEAIPMPEISSTPTASQIVERFHAKPVLMPLDNSVSAAVSDKETKEYTASELEEMLDKRLEKDRQSSAQKEEIISLKGEMNLIELTPQQRFEEDIKKTQAVSDWTSRMLADVHNMRDIIRHQLLSKFEESSIFSQMHKAFSSVGIRPELIPNLIGNMATNISEGKANGDIVQRAMESALVEMIATYPLPEIWSEKRTVLAIVGSPGSGKSSTVAKLASRFALRNKIEDVAIISLDSASHDQLKLHADLLGVDFYLLEEHQSLTERLRRLEDKTLILIDTIGCSHRDDRLIPALKRLAIKDQPISAMLVVSASQDAASLDAMTETYIQASIKTGVKLKECTVSKLDEAVRLGGLISTMTRFGLRLSYQSNGRDIMENFDRASATSIVGQAFQAARESHENSFVFDESETGKQFDSLREEVIGNIGKMMDVFTSLRREIKNAGYNAATRAVSGSETPIKSSALLHEATPSESAEAKRNLLWCMNDISIPYSLPILAGEGSGGSSSSEKIIGFTDKASGMITFR